MRKRTKYGYWVVVEERKGEDKALCKCTLCKQRYLVRKRNLIAGASVRCRDCANLKLSKAGVNTRKAAAKERAKEEVGKVYGMWTIKKMPTYYRGDGVKLTCKVALCECTCGKRVYRGLGRLKRGEAGKVCCHKNGRKK